MCACVCVRACLEVNQLYPCQFKYNVEKLTRGVIYVFDIEF